MSVYLAAGLACGVLCVIAYIVAANRRNESPSLETAVVIVISAVGVVVGGKVIYLCVKEQDLGPFGGEDAVYIVLGGLALIWVSIVQIRNGVFGPKDSED